MNLAEGPTKPKLTDADAAMVVCFRIAGGSNPNSIAGAIVKSAIAGRFVHLTAIGAGSVNQAVKALIIASNIVGTDYSLDSWYTASFGATNVKGKDVTFIEFVFHTQVKQRDPDYGKLECRFA